MRGTFFLVGPTAVGKSALAVEVSQQLGAEIVNADAFQIYRGLDILTGKPAADAQRRVPHHLLSVVKLSEAMSAAKFHPMALAALDDIWRRRKLAIVVSGSGLYVKAITHGFDKTIPPNPKLRAELGACSLEELAKRLRQLDADVASRTNLKNYRRVIRAIEIATSERQRKSVVAAVRPRRQYSCVNEPPFGLPPRTATAATPKAFRTQDNNLRGVFLTREREDLYARINERVNAMFREGVEGEVAALKNVGPTASQALGLREVQGLLAGEMSSDDCIAKIQQATRRYAKRQLTWFRHQTNFSQLNLTALSHQEATSAILRIIVQQ